VKGWPSLLNRLIVAQLGARRHYAIPRMLHEAEMLERFYTDICAVKSWPFLLRVLPSSLQPAGLKRLLGRVPKGVPPEKITAFTSFGWEYYQRQRRAKTHSEIIAAYLWSGQEFCNLILKQGFGKATGVYTFNGAGLELLQAAKAQGLRTIMEQTIAPRSIEQQLLREEQLAFPDWELPLPDDMLGEQFCQREQAEWRLADVILCGSEFVREGIAACGGPLERCAVVPYGVDVRFSPIERLPHEGPLRVLTVGAVGLRKGSPYVLEAAKQLKGTAVFRMVGSVQVLPKAESMLREHLELTGTIPRTEILSHYAWADVFLLPSLCEGSATVVYEALATGLPVICTPNTGSVVRDGVDGFIVPIRDAEAIVDGIERLTSDANLLAKMFAVAAESYACISLDRYRANLIQAIGS
ncbi:MAG: glycosyltransferase family 4 protein, partial [Streptococcus sp.]|nr:glycosyltransferase family 4 protein [Streptococcus sp.]